MRILFGVTGDGMGQASRARVVVDFLRGRSHDVMAVGSGASAGILNRWLGNVVQVPPGLQQGAPAASVAESAKSRAVTQQSLPNDELVAASPVARISEFSPELVISDCDTTTYEVGIRNEIPVVLIDNQQLIPRCKHDKDIIQGVEGDYEAAKTIIKSRFAGCQHYVIASFFAPKVRDKFADSTTIVPGILRAEVLAAKPAIGEHVLVFQSSSTDVSLLPSLRKLVDHRFIVYGLGHGPSEGNCVLREFSEQQFVDDLASASAVVTNGGLMLMQEAVYLQKPIFSVPVLHHFEQEMASRYVEKLGYGLTASYCHSDVVAWFLQHQQYYRQALGTHKQDGNELLYALLDKLIGTLPERHAGKKKRG